MGRRKLPLRGGVLMRGTIRKRTYESGATKWRVRLLVPVGEEGEKERISKTFDTKREAEQYRTEINHQIDRGTFFKPSTMPLSKFLERWERDYAESNLSPTTLARYRQLIKSRINPKLGHLPISGISIPTIQDFYHDQLENGMIKGEGGLSPNTVRQIHYLLRGAFERAVEWRLVEDNPFQRISPPKQQSNENTVQYLDTDEAVKFLKTAAERGTYYPLYHLAVLMGLRRSEILGLRWEDLDFDTRQANIQQALVYGEGQEPITKPPKTDGSSRTVALTREVIRLLQEWKTTQAEKRMTIGPAWENPDYVVTNNVGGFIGPSNIIRDFKQLLDQADLPDIRFQDLRHTHATLMLKQGEHPKVVSERLGHDSITMTLDTYSHVLPSLQEEAAQRLEDSLIEGLQVEPSIDSDH